MSAYDDYVESERDRLDREDRAYEEVTEDKAAMDQIFRDLAAPHAALFANPAKAYEAIWNGEFNTVEDQVRAAILREVRRREDLKRYCPIDVAA